MPRFAHQLSPGLPLGAISRMQRGYGASYALSIPFTQSRAAAGGKLAGVSAAIW